MEEEVEEAVVEVSALKLLDASLCMNFCNNTLNRAWAKIGGITIY